MKLYITDTSPYARIDRIVILEKQLGARVEPVRAGTRVRDSPFYAINPSGRVPYLVTDDGVGFEESTLICAHLDHVDGSPAFEPPADQAFELRRPEALARSLLDALAVWNRELRLRPENERSPAILEHELQRSRRLLDLELLNPGFRWRSGRPSLVDWANRLGERASIQATRPPAAAR